MTVKNYGRFSFFGLALFVLSAGYTSYAQETFAPALNLSDATVEKRIISHFDLDGKKVAQAFLREQNNRVFLYTHHPIERQIAVWDVTNVGQPTLVNNMRHDNAQNEENNLLILSLHDKSSRLPKSEKIFRPAQNFIVMDLSDSLNASIIGEFSGVTHIFSDSRDNYFVVHQNGITVLKEKKSNHKLIFDPYPNGQDYYGG